jgi:hypothetical protein
MSSVGSRLLFLLLRSFFFLLLLERLEGLEYSQVNFILDRILNLFPAVVVFHYGKFVRSYHNHGTTDLY